MPFTLSRRSFISLAAVGMAASTVISQGSGAGKTYAYVGSWTQGGMGVGGGGGISLFEVSGDGSLTFKNKLSSEFDDMNAGYLAISANGRYLYSTEEVSDLNQNASAGGGIFSFLINPNDGSLTYLNSRSSMGTNPSYIVIDDSGKYLVVSNHGGFAASTRVVLENGAPRIEKAYDDSTVAVLPLNVDGTLAPATDAAILERTGGKSGDRSQQSPHAHSINFDQTGQWVVIADKGTDRIYSYRLNRQNGTLGDARFVQTETGVAPRHSIFHPRAPYFFVSYEQTPQVAAFHFDSSNGEMRHLQTAQTVPSGAENGSRPSDIKIHPNGNFIYTATRGHDSIAIHRVDESSGLMEEIDIVSSGGVGPRGMTFDPSGNNMFVANLDSDEIITFSVDGDTGMLTDTGARSSVLKPACIKFLQV